MAPKNWHTVFYALTSSDINRFSNSFHYQNHCRRSFVTILSLKASLHLKCMATIVKCQVSKATIEIKTTSVTTHFKSVSVVSQGVREMS